VQQDHHGPIGRTGLGIADVENAGLDLFERAERRIRAHLDRREALRNGWRREVPEQNAGARHAQDGGTEEAATIMIDLRHVDLVT
jgi:hypothetical protein